jgi:hypothetical protein
MKDLEDTQEYPAFRRTDYSINSRKSTDEIHQIPIENVSIGVRCARLMQYALDRRFQIHERDLNFLAKGFVVGARTCF